MTTSANLEALLSQGLAYRCPPPWDCLAADPAGFYVAAEDDVSALRRQMLEADPATVSPAVENLFISAADGRPALVLAIRDSFTRSYRDIITDDGCLIDPEPPLLAGLRDQHTVDALAKTHDRLLLTADVEDALILRSLGLPAMPVAGMAQLAARHERPLASVFGIDRNLSDREQQAQLEQDFDEAAAACPGPATASDGDLSPQQQQAAAAQLDKAQLDKAQLDKAQLDKALRDDPLGCELRSRIPSEGCLDDDEDATTLVFVAWSVKSLRLGKPEPVRQAIDLLREFQQHRNWNLSKVFEWVPTSQTLQKIEFALAKRCEQWVQDAVLDNLHGSAVSLVGSDQRQRPAEPRTVAQVTRDLQAMLLATGSDQASRAQRRAVLLEYHRVLHRELVEPLLESLELTDDPRERLRCMQLANLAQVFFEQLPAAREEVLNLNLAASSPDGQRQVGKVKELLAISQQLMQCSREDAAWTTSTRVRRPPGGRQPATVHSPRFAGLEWMNRN